MLNWLFLFFWSALIFFFSSISDIGKDIPSQWIKIISYFFHFGEYAVLAFLIIRAFGGMPRISRKKILPLALIFAIIYAVSDEYHQSFVPGRNASVIDILVDSLGILTTMTFFHRKVIQANLKIKNQNAK